MGWAPGFCAGARRADPQGLKPVFCRELCGTAEAVPFRRARF